MWMNVKEMSSVVRTSSVQTTNRAMTASAKSDTSQRVTQLDAKVKFTQIIVLKFTNFTCLRTQIIKMRVIALLKLQDGWLDECSKALALDQFLFHWTYYSFIPNTATVWKSHI